MFAHLVLGVLRDGKPRHGYDVSGEIRMRCGIPSNPGNVYRELSKLSAIGLIEATEKAPEADARRNPYKISLEGCRRFDEWLRSPATQDDELPAWVAFLDHLPSEDLAPLLEQLQERLWQRTKVIARSRDEALARASNNGGLGRNDGAGCRRRWT